MRDGMIWSFLAIVIVLVLMGAYSVIKKKMHAKDVFKQVIMILAIWLFVMVILSIFN